MKWLSSKSQVAVCAGDNPDEMGGIDAAQPRANRDGMVRDDRRAVRGHFALAVMLDTHRFAEIPPRYRVPIAMVLGGAIELDAAHRLAGRP
jgi:hypothetical protein